MTTRSEIPKTYEPQAIEEKWYAEWLRHGCFTADPASPKEAYSIVIPPPNVTGVLTLGHVLNITIQDVLARRARMLNKEVLWLPGTDHAGIATQNVVERTLRKEGAMKHRDDLGREKLTEKIWEWKEKFGGIILQQLRALGASCDWSRTRFTMDAEYSRCVLRVFVELYEKGVIYRGKRMVNWCPVALTALSDEEVIMKPQNGVLTYFKVEVIAAPGTFLTIATTRPETIPGDSAVAVSPKDPRYARLVGQHVRRPLPRENQAPIPIIADEQIDPEFGTGVLKVTPAHDKADFEIGQRHGLAHIDIMHPNGTMNDLAGRDFAGLDRFAARTRAVEILQEIGALEKEEPYQNNVGYSERADVPIEPRLSEQWFLKYPRVEESRAVVADGQMHFFPERWAKVYDHWMANLQDWCISRQLWWGHRIPVWYRVQGSRLPSDHEGKLDAGSALYVGLEPPADPENWVQDPDVLDTWFSSWLWPFATMGWPEKTRTLAKFYPTTDLVTGPDIIFFWVARMIMAGFEFTAAMPFRNVYFTGIIRDKQGRKMSKSLGNSPDPLDLIARYGADALRFGVMRSAPLGQDILFDEKNVELGRNFCTKLWNAARFRQMSGASFQPARDKIDSALLTSDDQWILLHLNSAISEVSKALDEYRFSTAANVLHRFFWAEYCDWYLEASKAALSSGDAALQTNTLAVIDFVLARTLRLFHPFLPFITEELWHGLGYNEGLPAMRGGDTIMFAEWPREFSYDESSEQGRALEDGSNMANAKYETVEKGRDLRRDFNIASNKRIRFVIKPSASINPHDLNVLRVLLNAETLDVTPDYVPSKAAPAALTPLGELFLPLEGLIDVAAEKERLKKEIGKVEQEIAKVRQKLGNDNFVRGAPEHVVAEMHGREREWSAKLAHLTRMLETLLGLD